MLVCAELVDDVTPEVARLHHELFRNQANNILIIVRREIVIDCNLEPAIKYNIQYSIDERPVCIFDYTVLRSDLTLTLILASMEGNYLVDSFFTDGIGMVTALTCIFLLHTVCTRRFEHRNFADIPRVFVSRLVEVHERCPIIFIHTNSTILLITHRLDN